MRALVHTSTEFPHVDVFYTSPGGYLHYNLWAIAIGKRNYLLEDDKATVYVMGQQTFLYGKPDSKYFRLCCCYSTLLI